MNYFLWTLPFFVNFVANSATGYYVGCYVDRRLRILDGSKTYDKQNTIDRCVRRCGLRKSLYAGVEDSKECFCGNHIRNYPKLLSKWCNKPCGGNRRQKCGGFWKISIYRTNYKGVSIVGQGRKRRIQKNRENFVGCFLNKLPLILNGRLFKPRVVTIKGCTKRCARNQMRFAGVEFSKTSGGCLCGNYLRHHQRLPRSKCNTRCGGEKCEGRGTVAIYRTNYVNKGPNSVVCRAIACRSWNFRFRKCRIRRRNGKIVSVRVVRRHSRSPCIRGRSFGFKNSKFSSALWVKRGCRASFYVCFKQTEKGCKSGCGLNAECVAGQCHCRRGTVGNPYHRCEEACTCTVSGDPHYRTFDNQMIHFQGSCRYTLVKVTDRQSPHYFNIEVKNERRGQNRHVSFTRLVDIEVYGVKIQFHQKKVVFVNGRKQFLPIDHLQHKIQIYHTGNIIRLVVDFGLSVSWNGKTLVYVQMPRSFGNLVTGLCGNCNGKRDDYKTKEGHDVSHRRDKFSLIVDSFVVPATDADNERCGSEDIHRVCTSEMKQVIDEARYCGYLKVALGFKSPFRTCIALHPMIARQMYYSCRFDACSYFEDENRINETVCNIMESFALECETRGIVTKWRREDFCPMNCPQNMRYSSLVSGCPPSCLNPKPDQEQCHVPPTEGCECRDGYVRSGDECVPPAECGCLYQYGYIPLHKNVTTSDCGHLLSCDLVDNQPKIRKQVIDMRCHHNAECGLLRGEPHCVCKQGFFGDGVRKCEALCNGRKCASHAHCEHKRCLCDFGYHGNPYILCEPSGICGGMKCAPKAECLNGNCVCPKGFYGDGYKSCQVLCGGKVCVHNAHCHHSKCLCLPSYHGDGYSKCQALPMCDGQRCVDNAECINHQCTCKDGYYGNGLVNCQKLCNGKKCVRNAVCDQGVCVCLHGYHGNGLQKCFRDGICDDSECAENAVCKNYKCVCRSGFHGNGYKGCKAFCGTKICVENAECVQGTCMCNEGFHGDGSSKCQPARICGGKTCGPNAVCLNDMCQCPHGFHGDAFVSCERLCGYRKCVDHAYCYRGTCVCQDDFHGNGYIKCESIKMCNGSTCAVNAKCVNFQCVCLEGYVGDGLTQCEALCHGKPCGQYANCVDGVCKCKDGYHGNPFVRCESNEFCNQKKCAEFAVCQNDSCACKSGYYGNGLKNCKALCNGHKCAENANCVAGQCQCHEGFHGDGRGHCEALSICGGHLCADNAVCVSGHCQCTHGYHGNGDTKCKELCGGSMICRQHATCKDGTCVCDPGFHGDGSIECETLGTCGDRRCVQHSHCYKYRCVCDEGYKGNPYKRCYPVCNHHTCAEYAYCDNDKCVCQNGFHGNPYIKCEASHLCDGRVCAAYAECLNYQCVCKKGYVGVGSKKCEALCDNKKCADGAVCVNNTECKCVHGYHGNGFIKCEERGTCGGKVCAEYADCINYQCHCKHGFWGDGYFSCEPLCDGRSRCTKHAICVDKKCVCKMGYHGDGYVKCEDSGTCNGKLCAKNAECLNYHCVCKKGYHGDGFKHCLVYCDGKKCVKNSACISDSCVCDSGYHGNAYIKCEAYGVCGGQRCADYADCVNYRCACKENYIGDGYTQCNPLCSGRLCVMFATCVQNKCQCIDGYHGDGYVQCERAEQCGGKVCAANAECADYKCRCNHGYYGHAYTSCRALCNDTKCAPYAECMDDKCVCKDSYHGDGHIKCEPKYVCGGRKCTENAYCKDYKCLCLDGYHGDGYTHCDVLCDGKHCANNSFCDHGKCVCQDGYHGNGEIECEKLGVCGGRLCVGDAECLNYHCVCPQGYTGNPYKLCEPLCHGRKCVKYALCTDGGCKCQAGYHGNAYVKCERASLCGGKLCAENAECNYYHCICKPGYQGNGYEKCEALCNGRMCVRHAHCDNGKCLCDKGYQGNGNWKCEAEGICDGKKCADFAVCMNFMCVCPLGYFGDGYKSCKLFCRGKVCAENAACINGACTCKENFHGNGNLKCEPLGYCGGKKCSKFAVCRDYKCVCRPGFYGDGYNNCDAEGYCNGNKCATNAQCTNGKCVCRGGYYGDGSKECHQRCICAAHGNQHYIRYDGSVIHFQGPCTYTFTKTTLPMDRCSLNVEVRSGHCHGNRNETQTCSVSVDIHGFNIQLFRNKVVHVDNYLYHMPVYLNNGDIQVYPSGQWIVMQMRCGYTLWWNCDTMLFVEVSHKYGEHLSGLCGKCNGLKDDYRLKDGTSVSQYPKQKRDALIGQSFVVKDTQSERCKTTAPRQVYTEAQRQVGRSPELCGLIYHQHKSSPFTNCVHAYPKLAAALLHACIHDVWAVGSKERTRCNYLEAFAHSCKLGGIQVNWRSPTACPLTCPRNTRYSYAVSGCPRTCLNNTTNCTLPTTEGCECLPGYVYSDTMCVKPQQCGCHSTAHSYIPLNKNYTSDDCSTTRQCMLVQGHPIIATMKSDIQCAQNAICGVDQGVPHCTCLEGYKGDGYTCCTKGYHS